MESKSKKLRTGYTTGACAAAAAKAATMLLLQGQVATITSVKIPFPDGNRHAFSIQHLAFSIQNEKPIATASVIKDAGDDPDITNGAEIVAEVRLLPLTHPSPSPRSGGFAEEKRGEGKGEGDQLSFILLKGGRGVGTVTKPGLAVQVGEPAINPVPRRMIREAVGEALDKYPLPDGQAIEVTISVPNGEELATRTLNARLGITGGISILGTSGIVRPLSAEAWTASITAAMDVAIAMGCEEVVLSAGRVSEKAHMKKYNLPDEAYVMMGDYVEFSLAAAKKHNFKKIHISAHWAKLLKIAMRIPQTHVRHGAIDLGQTTLFLNTLLPGLLDPTYEFNTAREIYDVINSKPGAQSSEVYFRVCTMAKEYAEGIAADIPVTAHLVSYEGEIIAESK
ncbi:MAG: cobalt-precorrin-5B (C(1))-methyltransferase [Nitrospirae bacterium]|nr:cobalt-precorrin-5B (C(1))-methyltransferase [Nitrospirota bacterium]